MEVAPLVGAWIEIFVSAMSLLRLISSLLSWERGLKFSYQKVSHTLYTVAPLVGAWIEINKKAQKLKKTLVAPLVGAWIEMLIN